jgi:hypothetical protein
MLDTDCTMYEMSEAMRIKGACEESLVWLAAPVRRDTLFVSISENPPAQISWWSWWIFRHIKDKLTTQLRLFVLGYVCHNLSCNIYLKDPDTTDEEDKILWSRMQKKVAVVRRLNSGETVRVKNG